jgi:hypothetical protein
VIVFAHAGHWLLGLAYFFPVLVLIGMLVVGRVRDGRRRASQD